MLWHVAGQLSRAAQAQLDAQTHCDCIVILNSDAPFIREDN